MKRSIKIKFGIGISLIIFTAVLSACETADDNNLEQARSCIDSAAKLVNSDSAGAIAKATQCDTLVTNMTTPESGKIGFGAMLIVEGKFSSIATLVENLKQTSGSVISNGLSVLIFNGTTGSSNYTKSITYANRSGSAGILRISLLIQTSNIAAALGALAPGATAAQIKGAITALTPANANTPGSPEAALVTSVVSLQQNACSGAGSTSDLCTKLTAAVGTNTSSNSAILASIQAYGNL